MPKDNVLRAIKKASDKDTANYQEMSLEGYAVHGIAVFVDCATNNNSTAPDSRDGRGSVYYLASGPSLLEAFDQMSPLLATTSNVELHQPCQADTCNRTKENESEE